MLARAGHRPLLVERQREIGDALCGGFLSWRTLLTLERLGLPAHALGGHWVDHVALFAGGRVARARLPAHGLGVSRHRLDTLLLDLAERAGAAVERGVTVRHAEAGILKTADGAELAADALLLASGKHELRGLARPVPRADDPMLGLRARIAPALGLRDRIGSAVELHLFDGGYAGLVLQEDGSANLCMAVRRSRLDGGDPEALLDRLGRAIPHLGERLSWRATGTPIDAIANVPYGWRAAATVPGVFRLGDQAGVIPSLAGEGVGIALASGVRAADSLLAHGPAGAQRYQRDLRSALLRPIGVARSIATLAGGRGAHLLLSATQVLPGLTRAAARLTRISDYNG